MFAPTARIVWGSPVLITIDLCLVLELPSPVRLVALGRMRALLPEERDPVVRLQVDVLGVIDFGQQTAAVDAALIDSRVAQFALTGDLALRMSWARLPSSCWRSAGSIRVLPRRRGSRRWTGSRSRWRAGTTRSCGWRPTSP